MASLAGLLTRSDIAFARFEGGLSGPEKDAAIVAFRERVPVLLCTESGGEGRNIQFCNTLINFDIPWNPMAIEQRIGRIDRIGQTREVFVFNLVARGTLDEQVLRLLDEKINMFELVVGEAGAILGELDEEQDFADLVLDAWMETTEAGRRQGIRRPGPPARGGADAVRRRQGARRRPVRRRLRDGVTGTEAQTMTALRDFVADLMEQQGAAVERLEPDGLAVIAPPDVRAAFGWPELARLGFGAELPAAAQRVGMDGDWLERFEALLAERGRHAERQITLEQPAAAGDPERLLSPCPRPAQFGLAFPAPAAGLDPLPDSSRSAPRPCPTKSARACCGWASTPARGPHWGMCCRA